MIAISYRREDSLPTAGRLYDRLQAKFGKKNVFMDFDSIPPGMDFREQIKQMIERSSLVIAIIGPHWLGEQPDGSRRIDNPADFVRLEIAYALEGGIPVIPLLTNTTQMPKPEMLPPDIQELAFRHALPLDSGMDFHSHAERLITGIRKAVDAAPRSSRPQKIAEPTATAANARRLRKIVIWSAAILLAGAASAVWFFTAHRHEQQANGTRQALVVEQPKPAIAAQPPSTQPVAEATPHDIGAQKLTKVFVKKYGVSALLPTDVFPDAKKLSNSDQSFLQGNSWTGQTTLTFSSAREPLAKVYAECATEHSPQAPSKTVQYKVLKPSWFVVSGDLGPEADASLGFYTKGVKKDNLVVIMHFQWREDDFPFSEETFTAMSRGFDGH